MKKPPVMMIALMDDSVSSRRHKGLGLNAMRVLSIDTAETSCSLAFMEGSAVRSEAFLSSRITHSRVIVGMIDQMLTQQAGLSPHDLDGFVVSRGPGSFTGVRIGISVVKGMAYAVGKPVAGISSLDGIAWQFSRSTIPVCAMMDAKRGEVYSSVYRFGSTGLVEKSPEQVTDPENAIAGAGQHAFFCGSGAMAYREKIIKICGGTAVIAPEFQNYVRAAALVEAAMEQGKDAFKDPGSVLPIYLRRSDAEINFKGESRSCR